MALSASTLEGLILQELEANGIVTTGQYARTQELAEAIATAVVEHIQAAAEVPVTGGSSAGTYPVQ
ncbi:hypothetical protein [Ectothiorhodospira mobilis]|uniref:hypothetical protein n=1 Tax=Ectothiorhodospira mobilis TaxID=195064 RepID=UPI001902F6F8|nr:hypothetical protein [Ectothiorhodospira mobilis]MBK1690982.1 hypothetical protein [Ectothiorhodospira mobilis]